MKPDMKQLRESSFLAGANSNYLELLYEEYLKNPESIDSIWQETFSELPQVNGTDKETIHSEVKQYFSELSKQNKRSQVSQPTDAEHERKQIKVLQLISAYRFRGHQLANLDPLSMRNQPDAGDFSLEQYGLSEHDNEIVFNTGTFWGSKNLKLKDLVAALKSTYCGSIGYEYMHVTDTKEKRWIQAHIEGINPSEKINHFQKTRLLKLLTAAEGLERYLHTKYVGQKRFSLEGGESLIPVVNELIQRSGIQGVKEIVIGMAHRGRLNVLVNTLGKSPSLLFDEFEGKHQHDEDFTGDVKYHLGFSSDMKTPGGDVHVALAFNPSHLEIVSPVVVGSVRARQLRQDDNAKNQVIPVIIHGDAAFAGQGVVMETFNMSQVRGFSVGGTIHIVVNNQIGFTISNPMDARSTLYCTDVAKMVQAPIFHVNADDPEAVLYVTQLALDYRLKFQKDVVIDLVCYRRHGHNEADEPSVTQPLMYQKIKSLQTTRELYASSLVEEGFIKQNEADQFVKDYRATLESGEKIIPELLENVTHPFAKEWESHLGKGWSDKSFSAKTKISKPVLKKLTQQLEILPEGFEPHSRVKKIMGDRAKMHKGELSVDWGCAETLAYASLLNDDHPVRISGQDSGRGTFFHRHAVLHDQKTGKTYLPLQNIKEEQPLFLVIDSLLSEEAVLAFEYGYSTTDPKALIVWEAQFGDFANGAQVVVDQFISSGEQKWGRLSSLIMFLPHGYEGQGPEHSSARLERYLQLCAQHNIQICIPSTPAQAFHMIRRQVVGNIRKPMIVMTPKSLLRHKLATSSLSDLTDGMFHPVIPEIDKHDAKKVKRVVLCSGKVFYDLYQAREKLGKSNHEVALLRIEQLYPFPETYLSEQLKPYQHVKDIVWCQEEPMNQGAWYCSQHHFKNCLSDKQTLRYVGRKDSASPAVGHPALHVKQLNEFLKEAIEV